METPVFNPMINWIWVMPVAFFGLFAWRYHRNKVSLWNGIWFNGGLFSLLACLAFTILATRNLMLIKVSAVIFAIFFILLLILFFGQGFIYLWNAWLVWRRESHSLANSLTLFLGIFALLYPLWIQVLPKFVPPSVNYFINTLEAAFVLYLVAWFYDYFTLLVIYQFNRPKRNQDFIVVLGSGLINGTTVSPLLGARIQRGVDFYQRQLRETGKPAQLIFSGGQGPDEKLPEGVAMLNYAHQHGLPENVGIAEKESRTTLENMRFSKRIIDAAGANQRVIFVSNNYHTFRAGIFARMVGLKADGIGAHTAWFFLPNAIIREYIAIFLQHKKAHIVLTILIFLFTLYQTIAIYDPQSLNWWRH